MTARAPILLGLACRCPRCGQGRLFRGLLTVRETCESCALDLKAADSGDGPAVFVILILGALLAPLVFWVEFGLQPPFWVHLVLWPPLVIGAALEEGVIRPDSAVVVGPTIKKGDTVFRDSYPNYQPRKMSLPGILAYSSNVGTIKIADLLGPQKLYEYQQRFGLGQATGAGVPGESSGLVQPPRNWSETSHGSIPIGHGVAVTPLQIMGAFITVGAIVWLGVSKK